MTDERIDPIGSVNTGTDLYRVPAPAAAGRIAMVRTLLCPARDYGRDGRVFRCNAAARGVRIVTWGISRNPLRPGALVTAGDVCHLHGDRAAAERCGALMGGAPDLVRLENHTARVYRVLWSLSDVAGGELRKPAPPPAPPPAKRPGAVRSWPGDRPHKRPCGGARRLGAADGGRSLTVTWADVERAVSGRSGRGPRNGRVWDGDGRARSRRWFNAGVPDDEIPDLQRGLRRIRSERASSPAIGLDWGGSP